MNEGVQSQAARCYSHLSHQGSFRRWVATSVGEAVRTSHPNTVPGECKPAQPSRAIASKDLKTREHVSQRIHLRKRIHRPKHAEMMY